MENNLKIERKEKKEVPQVHLDTGVSQDYSNSFNPFVSVYFSRGMDSVKKFLKETPRSVVVIKKYEDLYSECRDVVNDKNKRKVKWIDELAEHMNEMTKNPDSIDEEDFCNTCNELNLLIYGDSTRNIEPKK